MRIALPLLALVAFSLPAIAADEAQLIVEGKRLAEINFQRDQRLLTTRAISRTDFDKTESVLKDVSAQAEKTEAIIARKHLRAPFAGQIGIPRVDEGMYVTEAFYWDANDETRAWSKRFIEKHKRMPTMVQAGQYSSTLHYLKAVKAAGTDDTAAVMKKMKEMPVNDFFAKNAKIRDDGRLVHDFYLLQVKKPEESKNAWDYYTVKAIIAANDAVIPVAKSECPLLKK